MLTEQEIKELDLIGLVGFDILRVEAAKANVKIPCWLCTDEKFRAETRQKAVDWLNAQMHPIVPLDLKTALWVIEKNCPSLQAKLDLWREMEDTLKTAREAGNPAAFFV